MWLRKSHLPVELVASPKLHPRSRKFKENSLVTKLFVMERIG